MGVSLAGLDSFSRSEVRHLMPLLKKINKLAPVMKGMTDEELANQTNVLRKKYKQEKSLDKILPEAFATVREASVRATGLYPFDVQVLGGIVLYRGQVAEMKTGEGKTLVAAMPSYLMALTGRGVHVVTVNDYLAKRDADDIGRIHRFLGLTVGCVLSDMHGDLRRKQYDCDITYVTNSEVGFDYLRDNMVMNLKDRVLRGLHYAIIDEVDSILIDEARTPLIISGAKGNAGDFYRKVDMLVCLLKRGDTEGELTKMDMLSGKRTEESGDYVVDEKEQQVHLTDKGVAKIEEILGIHNYSDPEHALLRHHVQAALRAHGLMRKDKEYIVKDGEIIIVDTFTGRMMPGRRYSDGLHQALEAKEHVEVREETQTMATITYQNFFNKYERKAGMTGTAMTSADEFETIYGLEVVAIPTNVPMIRVDEEDAVYLSKGAKRRAIVMAIANAHDCGQPVLVGTTNIAESEILSRHLKDFNIPHRVLNAKYHAQEAEIISHAGEVGMITIATNMAGRGTDIKLTEESRALGGLLVIGTERHEARRIDNQLRGRSGRQGDPGRSKFYLSLEDDVMRLFGSEKMISMLKSIGADEWAPIEHRMLSKMVNDAQRHIENNNFGIRKALLDYDEVNNEHRELIYSQRNAILNGANPERFVSNMVTDVATCLVKKHCGGSRASWDFDAFLKDWSDVFPEPIKVSADKNVMMSTAQSEAKRMLRDHLKKFQLVGDIRNMERYVILKCIDWQWLQHLNRLEHLKQAVGFTGYGQRKPVVVYKDKAYDAFADLLVDIRYMLVKLLFRTTAPVSIVVSDVPDLTSSVS